MDPLCLKTSPSDQLARGHQTRATFSVEHVPEHTNVRIGSISPTKDNSLHTSKYDFKPTASSIQAIPPEILGQIFINCLADEHCKILPRKTTAPLLVAQVCSIWRTVALSTPQLWSSMLITFPMQERLANAWLSRSGGLPLKIGIESESYDWPGVFLDILARHSHRICDLQCYLPAPAMHQLLGHPRMDFKHLEEISLFSLTILKNENLFDPLILPTSTENLRRVILSSAPFLVSRNTFDLPILPWNHLTHFSAIGLDMTVYQIVEVLRNSPLLIGLDASIIDHPSPITSPSSIQPVVSHFCLKSFKLKLKLQLREHVLGSLFDCLSLHGLELLRILDPSSSSGENNAPESIPEIISCLSRSACPLKSLIVGGWKISDGDLRACAHSFPSLLEIINVVHMSFPDGTVRIEDTVTEELSQLLASRRFGNKQASAAIRNAI